MMPNVNPTPTTRAPHFRRDATARAYEEILLPRVFDPWARVLLGVVPPRLGEIVLDVATGPGTLAHPLAALVGPNGRVAAVDVSRAMLTVARSRPHEPGSAAIHFVEASAEQLPLASASFDLALCQQGLQHMANPTAALKEMRHLLHPKGRLGVAAWTESPFALFRQAASAFLPDAIHPSGFGSDAEKLRTLLESLGFVRVIVQTHHLAIVFEGGIPQALQVAEVSSVGPLLRELPADQRGSARNAIEKALAPFVQGEVVRLPSAANIASAVAA